MQPCRLFGWFILGATITNLASLNAQPESAVPPADRVTVAKDRDIELRRVEGRCASLAAQGRLMQANVECQAALGVLDQMAKLQLPKAWKTYISKQRSEIYRFMSSFPLGTSGDAPRLTPGTVFFGGGFGAPPVILSTEPLMRHAGLSANILAPGILELTMAWSSFSTDAAVDSFIYTIPLVQPAPSGIAGTLLPALGIRLGVTQRLEIGLNWGGFATLPGSVSSVDRSSEQGPRVKGSLDGALEVKLLLRRQHHLFPLVSLAGGVNLPLGHARDDVRIFPGSPCIPEIYCPSEVLTNYRVLGTGRFDPFIAVLGTSSLTRRLSLNYGVGASAATSTEFLFIPPDGSVSVQRETIPFLTYGVGGAVIAKQSETGNVNVYAEYWESHPFGTLPVGLDLPLETYQAPVAIRRSIDVGITLHHSSPRRPLSVSVMFGKGLTAGTPNWNVGIALSVAGRLWNHPRHGTLGPEILTSPE